MKKKWKVKLLKGFLAVAIVSGIGINNYNVSEKLSWIVSDGMDIRPDDTDKFDLKVK